MLLSERYENAKQKLSVRCPQGHVFSIRWSDWNGKRKHRCPYCSGNAKLNLDVVRKIFEDEGYTLLSTEYRNNKQKVRYKCPNGHVHTVRIDHFQRGVRCPFCSNTFKKSIDYIRPFFEAEGYTLLSDTYKNSFAPLKCRCPEGHIFITTWHNWHSAGNRCAKCAGYEDTESVRDLFAKEGYTLVTPTYTNSAEKLHVICPNGHDYYVRLNNWKNKSSRCPLCSGSGRSNLESDVEQFLLSFVEDVRSNVKDVIPPYELDLYIPSLRVAVEVCGLYWHSEAQGKGPKYHLNKLERCIKENIRLITIFEDELLFKKEIVFSRLRHILGFSDVQVIYARWCSLKPIDAQSARLFCESYHIQGYGAGSTIKLGLFYGDNLVSVMTFSKPSLAKGSKQITPFHYELHRFCSDARYRITGGASKLLTYFKRNYQWQKIYTFADRRWSDGSVYERLGFTFKGVTAPNYWYFKNKKRVSRFRLRKTSADNPHLTEWENRQLDGWNRIWDCGNLKYECIR